MVLVKIVSEITFYKITLNNNFKHILMKIYHKYIVNIDDNLI